MLVGVCAALRPQVRVDSLTQRGLLGQLFLRKVGVRLAILLNSTGQGDGLGVSLVASRSRGRNANTRWLCVAEKVLGDVGSLTCPTCPSPSGGSVCACFFFSSSRSMRCFTESLLSRTTSSYCGLAEAHHTRMHAHIQGM